MMEEKKEGYLVDNAVIMAAGLSSRFAPLSYEYPKALVEVKGEVLIERQIRQLKEAGIHDITIVVGYKKELFAYLVDKCDVNIVENPEYSQRNNHSSLYYVKEKLGNTYICSADNYFSQNVFEKKINQSYYSAVFEAGETDEWTLQTDETGLILDAKIGGTDSWVMLGHVFFSADFSKRFVAILEEIYDLPQTASLLWESIYLEYIKELPLYIRKYSADIIFEFDSLDELREFDKSYWKDSRSEILKNIAKELEVRESEIVGIEPDKNDGETVGFDFIVQGQAYAYDYERELLVEK